MAKRKREVVQDNALARGGKAAKIASSPAASNKTSANQLHRAAEAKASAGKTAAADKHNGTVTVLDANDRDSPITVQIVTGSYERVLHGITATIPPAVSSPTQNGDADTEVHFADTFLFDAHASPIRCLALSPPSDNADSASQKIILASGDKDGRVNLYHLSNAPPPVGAAPNLPNLAGHAVAQNPRNRELGILTHHTRSVAALHFPTRAKLLTCAEDNTLAILRTRDWAVLSTIKAPDPKVSNQPSGDTKEQGKGNVGMNDFAVHPSTKLMVSVGKGERCMRLWNLVTGKRAGVLSFERELLKEVGERVFGSHGGEGNRVEWDTAGEEFAIAFERGAVVYGMDCNPQALIRPSPPTKIHQLRYLPLSTASKSRNILAISTEDGRILFFPTDASSASSPTPSAPSTDRNRTSTTVPHCSLLAQLGGHTTASAERIKDFDILYLPSSPPDAEQSLLFTTASSDGAVRLWTLEASELATPAPETSETAPAESNGVADPKQVGRLIGTYETGNRITCLRAFVMTGTPEVGDLDGPSEGDNGEGRSGNDSDSDSSS
ncbi:hypothetical protein LTR04_000746 [Oleoguttula sp. CCFEE 6159]|nr:hypothetical protein LTR04_000746 [Oleoguttula sp. CCFEE 6159]